MLVQEPPADTFTVADTVMLPPAEFVAVIVYVVVWVGLTVLCPYGATEPILVMLTVVASYVSHEMELDSPGQILLGVAVILPETIWAWASLESEESPKATTKNKLNMINRPALFLKINFEFFIAVVWVNKIFKSS